MRSRLLAGVALALTLVVGAINLRAEALEYHPVLRAKSNVAHWILYDESVPFPHQVTDGTGDLYYFRIGDTQCVYGKIDIQATAVGLVTELYMSLPYDPYFTNYAQASGSGINYADKPTMGVFGAVEESGYDNHQNVVLRLIPTDLNPRAYMLNFCANINPAY